ncbi:C4-dicarboxylate ABC transporter, partial [Pseudomonas syringae pv. tagetis]
KWFEVARYVSLSNLLWSANFWFLNKDNSECLSETDRAALDNAVVTTTAWYRSHLEAEYSKIQQEMQGIGVKFNDVNPR